MSEFRYRLTVFVGATAMVFAFFVIGWSILWALVSFAAWRAFGLPPFDLIRFLFGVSALMGGICAIIIDDGEGS